jgi:hypothetical protein
LVIQEGQVAVEVMMLSLLLPLLEQIMKDQVIHPLFLLHKVMMVVLSKIVLQAQRLEAAVLVL